MPEHFQPGDRVRHKRSGRLGHVDRTEEETGDGGHHYVTVIWDDDEGFGPIESADLVHVAEDAQRREDPCG